MEEEGGVVEVSMKRNGGIESLMGRIGGRRRQRGEGLKRKKKGRWRGNDRGRESRRGGYCSYSLYFSNLKSILCLSHSYINFIHIYSIISIISNS